MASGILWPNQKGEDVMQILHVRTQKPAHSNLNKMSI